MAGWRSREHDRRRARAAVVAGLVASAALGMFGAAAGADPSPFSAEVSAGNGEGRSEAPGRPCSEGGVGAYWHYDWSADIGAGPLGTPDVEALTHLQVSSDTQRFPNVEGAYAAGTPAAYLQGGESFAALLTDRGSAKLQLRSGDCADPTLLFDGSTAQGSGTWEVVSGTGAYRDLSGSGTFDVEAELEPGADNDLSLQLAGTVDVPTPALDLKVLRTFWGNLGTDYLSRRTTVVFEVTNVGDGDAYGAQVTMVDSPNQGATRLGSPTVDLGDLAVGESAVFSRRFQFKLAGPCDLIILNCKFAVDVTADMPDALDRSNVFTERVWPKAPNLPPPL